MREDRFGQLIGLRLAYVNNNSLLERVYEYLWYIK